MIRIGIIGDIGSGKTFVANNFGYPVFNADLEVAKIYKKDKKVFLKLKNKLPKYITRFPVDKNEITNAILNNQNNLIKIIKIVHKEIRKKLNFFLKKNKNKKIVILDIPLLIENKLFNKKDLLVFVDSKKKDIDKRIKKRPKYNSKLLKIFKKIQLSPSYKKKISHFKIKNTFTKKPVKNEIIKIINKIL
jgi:dephospho-CoA kinase